jgi:hypothetical protein
MYRESLSIMTKNGWWVLLVVAMAIIAGMHGMMASVSPSTLPLGGVTKTFTFVGVMLLGAALVYALSLHAAKSPLAIATLLSLAIAVVVGVIWPILVVVLIGTASHSLGRWILRHANLEQRPDDPVIFMLVGLGSYATVVSLAAHIPVNYPGVYLASLLLPIYLDRASIGAALRDWLALRPSGCSSRFGDRFVQALTGVVGMLHFCFALLPEVMHDALALHLFVPVHMAVRHEWGFNPSLYSQALIPMLGNWIYSMGYMLAGESAARLLNVSFLFVLAYIGRILVLWAGGSDRGASWGMLMFLATPLCFTESSSLFVEAMWTAYVVTGIYLLARVVTRDDPVERAQDIVVAGLLLGFAAAAKPLTLTYLPAFAPLLLARWRVWAYASLVKSYLKGGLAFVAVGTIPYIAAYLISGNPVFPFYNEIFKSPYYPPFNFDNPIFKAGVTWDLPYQVVFASEKYLEATMGVSGFQWLLLMPVTGLLILVARGWRAMMLLAVAVLALLVVFHFQSYLRYIFPVVLLMSVLIGVALDQVRGMGHIARVAMLLGATLTVMLNLAFFTSGVWVYRDLPIGALFNEAARERLLLERMPIRHAVALANSLNGTRAPVAFFSPPFGAGLHADALYPNWYNYVFEREVAGAHDARAVASALGKYGARIVILDANWPNETVRGAVIDATRPIAEFGTISVRMLRDELRFARELLVDAELDALNGWTPLPGSKHDPVIGAVTVNVDAPVVQLVAIDAGRSYVNRVRARCAEEGGEARAQVNWLDAQGAFISTDIKSAPCTSDWSELGQELRAPEKAMTAAVYAAAHTRRSVEIAAVSFRAE